MSNKVEQSNYSFPMTMGKKNTALDVTQWVERSMAVFGRVVPMSNALTNDELRKMGFQEAAENFSLYGRR